MKLNKFIIKSAAVALIIGTALPLAAAAQLDSPAGNMKQPRGQSRDFCGVLSSGEASEKNKERRQEREARLTEKRAGRKAGLEKKRQERDINLEERRAVADERRAQIEAKLSELAKTSVQKEAVTAFQAAVEVAVQARRDAYDATNEAFRNGLDQEVTDRKATLDIIIETYKLQVDAAESKAKTDCEAEDADRVQIRTALLETVKAARDEMKESVVAVENVGQIAAALQDARKTAMEAAREVFRAALEQARIDLKAILEADKPPKPSEDDEE